MTNPCIAFCTSDWHIGERSNEALQKDIIWVKGIIGFKPRPCFDILHFPLIPKFYPRLITKDVVAVQPMKRPQMMAPSHSLDDADVIMKKLIQGMGVPLKYLGMADLKFDSNVDKYMFGKPPKQKRGN